VRQHIGQIADFILAPWVCHRIYLKKQQRNSYQSQSAICQRDHTSTKYAFHFWLRDME